MLAVCTHVAWQLRQSMVPGLAVVPVDASLACLSPVAAILVSSFLTSRARLDQMHCLALGRVAILSSQSEAKLDAKYKS